MLRWIGRHKVCTADQVADRFGIHKTKAYRRLRVMKSAGLLTLDSEHLSKGVYRATPSGLEFAGHDLPASRFSLATLLHELALVDLLTEFEREPSNVVQTERELKATTHNSSTVDTLRSLPIPDASVTLPSGAVWAVEIELTRKASRRLNLKLRQYAIDRRYDGICYFVETESMARWLKQRAQNIGLIAPRFDIQQLAGDHSLGTVNRQPPSTASDEIATFLAGTPSERAAIIQRWEIEYRGAA